MMYLLSVNPQTDLLGDKFTLILSKILKRFSLLANVVFRMCLKLTCWSSLLLQTNQNLFFQHHGSQFI